MSITLVAVVLALVLGHVAPTLVASLRRYAWYDAWLHWLGESAGGAWQARHGIALALVPVLLAILVGGGQAVQQATNVKVNAASRRLIATTWLNFLTGTALLALLALGAWALGDLAWTSLAGVPWWAFLGGLLGIGFIAIAAWAVNQLGVFTYTLPMLTGFLGTAVLLDLLHPQARESVTPLVLLGVVITFASAVLAAMLARPRRRPA